MNETCVCDKICWFVMRVTYQRELIAKAKLEALNVECFVPTRNVCYKNKAGRYVAVIESLLHNYIFIHTSRSVINDLKRVSLPWLRWVMRKDDNGFNVVQTVPESQMKSFIAVAGNTEEKVQFLHLDDLNLLKGDRVRVLAGPFKGVEGVLLRLSRKRDRYVVVEIPGIVAVATAAMPLAYVEKI